jgi:uncharacterized protein involved in exopolysaccharide biosynthesis
MKAHRLITTDLPEEQMSLRRFVAEIAENRWWLIGSVCICAALFAALAFLTTPVYRAAAVMLPSTVDRASLGSSLTSTLGQSSTLTSLLGLNLGGVDNGTTEALAVLRSREFTERFIIDNNLMPVLFERKWDAARKTWRVPPEDVPTPGKAFHYFDESVRFIDEDKKTNVVRLQIEWKDRNQAAAWANELARRLNAEMRDRAMSHANASIQFLAKELAGTTVVEIRESINRLIEAQEKQRMLASVTPDFAFRIVDKAMAPDHDDPIKPKKALLLLLGPFIGLALGVLAILTINSLRESMTRQ